MKATILLATAMTISLFTSAQDGGTKPPPASPPASAKQTLKGGAVVSINYGQPSVKGRTIGTDLEPMPGKVWRAGANAATVFETSKDVRVQGRDLPAGKYGFFVIDNGGEWTLIFNKVHDQWGAYEYKESEDALRVNAKAGKAEPFSEKLTYNINKDGNVTIQWGAKEVKFRVEG
ncbi:MAG: DUF2911 domain-containing protein [Chitinophagaceae bacterium]|nr:DUF2911 domain-containing protein [Chitinophagaceae bacterium]